MRSGSVVEEVGVCILKPANPAVLNLCLPEEEEEEATGRTRTAPLGLNFNKQLRLTTVSFPRSCCKATDHR